MTVGELIARLKRYDPSWPIAIDDGVQIYPVVDITTWDIPAIALVGNRDQGIGPTKESQP
jgi:hypothetical protein